MDSTGESQTASVRQSEPGLGEEVMDFAAQNRDEAALPGNCNAASTHAAADFSAPTETDRTEEGWQISQSLRAKKKQAKERKFQQGGDFSAGSRPTTDSQPKRRGRPTRRRPPALPKDDLTVVFRPHQGLPLKNVTTQAISDAIVEACQGKVRWVQFILRIRTGSNIALASTPDTTVAMAMRGITSLNINGRPHPVNVYVTAGEGTKKGVIHGIEPHTPSETIKASIRFRTQSVTLVDARMLGDSQSAVLTFFGDILPRYVYYRGGEKECIPFRNTVQFCRACGAVGHSTDVCPQPDSPVCHTCGMRNPEVNHNCTPTCAICTGNHITGDRSCLKRLKPIRKQAAKPPKKPHKPAPRWFQSEEEESEWEYGRGGTRKSRSRTRTPSKNRAVETGQPGQRHPKSTSTPRAISQDNPNAQALPRSKQPGACPAHSNPQAVAVSYAQAVSPTTKHKPVTPTITEHPEYKRVVAENRQLRTELQEVKSRMARLESLLNQSSNTQSPASTPVVSQPVAQPVETQPPQTPPIAFLVQQIQLVFAKLGQMERTISDLSQAQNPRKRSCQSPGAPTRQPKESGITDSENTNHG
ncbi:hypothetical protein HPB51_008921 [Rhipicephalus microplus]|uniref:CCHC-type domain-containing protein n=1 Tax=Rhipicephalus microplus TaxID=6941 RepID=A0A9J6E8X3_RHIMP|nr:hypothetical protein HPB51_008921 [Rhipicephalus microplus]